MKKKFDPDTNVTENAYSFFRFVMIILIKDIQDKGVRIMGKNIVKIKTILILLGLLFSCTVISLAGQIPEGIWYQTSSTAGDCPNCEIVIKKITPPHTLY